MGHACAGLAGCRVQLTELQGKIAATKTASKKSFATPLPTWTMQISVLSYADEK
jgi:hypothetical protein